MLSPAIQTLFLPDAPPFFYGACDNVYEVQLHEPDGYPPRVPEALVQDLWQARRFDLSALTTTEGLPITILDPGTLNTDSGPDFSGARIRIGEMLWTGDVEIHTTSGVWFDHRHHTDPAYNRTILHVALHADIWSGGLLRADGTTLPELILFPHLDASLRHLLHQFYTHPAQAPICTPVWHHVPTAVKIAWIQDLAEERIKTKRDRLAAVYLDTPDLTTLLHERLYAALGYAKNTEAMTTLARRLPLSLVRTVEDPHDLEALHFGVAGLLPTPTDLLHSDRASADYAMDLHERFDRLQLRFDLTPMERRAWRFFRLRPANFPTLRIAQAVALVCQDGLLQNNPVETLLTALDAPEPVAALRATFNTTPGTFWKTHLRFEKTTRPRNPAIGRSQLDALIANAVVPILLLHAEQADDVALEAALFNLMRQLPPSTDEITRRFATLGTRADSAFTTQGLHQLYRTRCTDARCITCQIGQYILQEL